MNQLIIILLGAVLVNNVVLTQFLGICPFLGVSKKLDSAVGMSLAVTFVLILASAVTFPIYHGLLESNGFGYMQTVVFILVSAARGQLVEIIHKRYVPSLHKSLGIYLPLITTNCAVLGVTIQNIDNSYTFVESLFYAFGIGMGFLLAMVLFSGVRQRIDSAPIPKFFKGMPSVLIAASLVSLSFMGFSGVVEGIFG